MGSPSTGIGTGVGCIVSRTAGKGRDLGVILLVGKGPELLREVERYQLDILGLTSTHSAGSGTKLLQRSWTLLFQSCPE